MITSYVVNENQSMKVKGVKAETPGPRQNTLEWIRQFTRIYAYEPQLGTDNLGSFIVN